MTDAHARTHRAPVGDDAVHAGSAALSRFAEAHDRPVFVGACPRSGTTLLRTMLDNHPDLAIPHETKFFVDAWKERPRFGDLTVRKNRRRLAQWIIRRPKGRAGRLKIGRKELAAGLVAAPPTLGSLLGTCFALYAERTGKGRWGDKRPVYAQHLDAIFAMFPDAQFINLVRDPRAVVASIRKIGWYRGDVVPAFELWERSLRRVDAWRKRLAPDQLLEIQYEDLVAEPHAVLERVRAFLRLDPDGVESMFNFYEGSDLPKNQKFHGRLAQPVSTAAVHSWKDTLTAEEISFVEWAAAATMHRYGYEPIAGGKSFPAEWRRALRQRRREKATERLRYRMTEAKRRFTYRQPVAARLTSSQVLLRNSSARSPLAGLPRGRSRPASRNSA